MYLFADDAKLYQTIRCNNDLDSFQDNLNVLCDWSSKWRLNISVSKCCTMNITCNNRLNSDSINSNSINNIALNNVNNTRDLGVIVDSKLKFTSHIAKIVSSAKLRTSLLYFITEILSH